MKKKTLARDEGIHREEKLLEKIYKYIIRPSQEFVNMDSPKPSASRREHMNWRINLFCRVIAVLVLLAGIKLIFLTF